MGTEVGLAALGFSFDDNLVRALTFDDAYPYNSNTKIFLGTVVNPMNARKFCYDDR